jgi:hypothetical protein
MYCLLQPLESRTHFNSAIFDPTFDRDGLSAVPQSGPLDDTADRLLITPAGQTLLLTNGGIGSGDQRLTVRRYTASLAIDSSFDGDGKRVLDRSVVSGKAVVDASGRLVMPSNNALVRYTSTGAQDTLFGIGGQLALDSSDILLAADGNRVLVLSYVNSAGGMQLRRVTAAGAFEDK